MIQEHHMSHQPILKKVDKDHGSARALYWAKLKRINKVSNRLQQPGEQKRLQNFAYNGREGNGTEIWINARREQERSLE